MVLLKTFAHLRGRQRQGLTAKSEHAGKGDALRLCRQQKPNCMCIKSHKLFITDMIVTT